MKFTPETHLTILSNSLLPWIKFIPMQPVVLHEERSSSKQHQVNAERIFKAFGSKIWDCFHPSLHALSTFTFTKRYRDILIATLSLSKWCWCFAPHICPQCFSLCSRLTLPPVHIAVTFTLKLFSLCACGCFVLLLVFFCFDHFWWLMKF